jgi:hypothetical protein
VARNGDLSFTKFLAEKSRSRSRNTVKSIAKSISRSNVDEERKLFKDRSPLMELGPDQVSKNQL